jgi:hypothetical protein
MQPSRRAGRFENMAMKLDGIAESGVAYQADIDYEYEHRSAEQEHDTGTCN